MCYISWSLVPLDLNLVIKKEEQSRNELNLVSQFCPISGLIGSLASLAIVSTGSLLRTSYWFKGGSLLMLRKRSSSGLKLLWAVSF